MSADWLPAMDAWMKRCFAAEAQQDSLARACERALVDLRAAKVLAQHTLGEPYGINQTIEIVESALEGYRAGVAASTVSPSNCEGK